MKNKKTFFKTLSVVLAILLWQVLALTVNSEILVPSPFRVIKRLFSLLFEKDFLSTVIFSWSHITLGFLFAFLLGIFLAVLCSKVKMFEYLLWPYVVTIKSVPVASFIIICLIWLSFNQLTVFIAFLIAFPVIYTNVLSGIKNSDKDLKEVAKLYRVPWSKKLIYIYLPSIKPFLISSTGLSVGMAWKAGVAAEVIGVVTGSIGGKMYNAKLLLENVDLLAWTVLIILLSALTEKLFVFALKLFFKKVEKI